MDATTGATTMTEAEAIEQAKAGERAAIVAWLDISAEKMESSASKMKWWQFIKAFRVREMGNTMVAVSKRVARGEHHKETEG